MLAGTFGAAVGLNAIVERAGNDICIGGRIEVAGVVGGGSPGFRGIGGFEEWWLRRRRGKKRIRVGGCREGERMVRGGEGGGEGGHGTPVIRVGLGGYTVTNVVTAVVAVED